METLNLEDMQSLIRHGYPFYKDAVYRFLSIEDADAFKRWLGKLLSDGWIDSAATPGSVQIVHPRGCAVAIAFAPGGLKALGLNEDAMNTFVGEFQEGMDAPHRARLLGDVGASDPANRANAWKQAYDVLLSRTSRNQTG